MDRKQEKILNQHDANQDIELWLQLKSGNAHAFQIIYEAHIQALLQYGKRFSQDSQRVEDCIHDLFVNLWRNRDTIGKTDSIRRYLLVSLRRSIIKQITKASRTQEISEEQPLQLVFTGSIEKELIDSEINLENQSRLAEAMKTLSARQQEAIYLKYHRELSYEDVAQIMEINYQSVRNLVFNGITKLRKLLASPAVQALLMLYLIKAHDKFLYFFEYMM